MARISIYAALSRIKFLSGNYALKFLFIAFIGIHIPLLGVIFLLLYGSPSAWLIFLVTLGCTLLACAVTLYILRALLEPLHRSFLALKTYLYKRELPNLPTQYPDEAGQLMRKTQLTLQRLDDLLREKQELAALLSHDLRAPLANIASLAALIGTEEDLGGIRFMADKIANQMTGQLRFVDDILAKMRLTDNNVEALDIRPTLISPLIGQVTAQLENQLMAKQLTITDHIPPDLQLNLDAGQIVHVFQNLLTNAAKFSYPGGLIRLTCSKEENQIVIRIQDEGLGFSEAQSRRLFGRYQQGHAGTAGEPSTGIGLYLAQKIMRQHGGDIRAESPGPGKGAVFSLVFPF